MPKKMQRMAKRKLFIGIDPGKTGGVVAITKDKSVVICEPMPRTTRDLWLLLSRTEGAHQAVLERVWGRPGEGGKSSFTFGCGYGEIRMALTAADIPFADVTPTTWIRALNIPPRRKTDSRPEWKERLRAKGQQMFPTLQLWGDTLTRQRSICDALLIAEYCRQNYYVVAYDGNNLSPRDKHGG